MLFYLDNLLNFYIFLRTLICHLVFKNWKIIVMATKFSFLRPLKINSHFEHISLYVPVNNKTIVINN